MRRRKIARRLSKSSLQLCQGARLILYPKICKGVCNATAFALQNIPADEVIMSAECDDGYITEIQWYSPSPLCVLNGTISPSIVDLSKLTYIIITADNADLSGTLPPDLHRLAKLNQLTIHQPRMTGPIPSWNDNLTALSISPSLLQNTYFGEEFLKQIVQLDPFSISNIQFSPPQSYWSSFVHFLNVPLIRCPLQMKYQTAPTCNARK